MPTGTPFLISIDMKNYLHKPLYVALVLLAFATSVNAADFDVDGIYYDIISEAPAKVAVTRGESAYQGEVSIPASVENGGVTYLVTEIGDYAFSGCYDALTSISFSEGLEKIGVGAFSNCSGLKTIKLPDTLQEVAQEAFVSCFYVTNLDLGAGVKKIGPGAFRGLMSITDLSIPDSCEEISHMAFQGCGSSVQSLKIGSGLKYIGGYAFFAFLNIPEVTLPEGLETLESCAFEQCNNLKTFHIPASVSEIGVGVVSGDKLESITVGEGNPVCVAVDGVLFSKDMKTLITYPGNRAGETYQIPAGVKTIGVNSFAKALHLKSMIFPDGVETIMDAAFYCSPALTEITFPESLTAVNRTAFYSCYKLRDINFSTGLTSIGEMAFAYCGENLKQVSIPNSVTDMGEAAFYCCDVLETVYVPASIGSISEQMFNRCYGLKNVNMAEGLTRIEDDAFGECGSLETLITPNSMLSIGQGVFFNCKALRSVTLGSSMKVIGNFTFDNCTAIQEVKSFNVTPPNLYGFPQEVYRNATLYVPKSALADYNDHYVWNSFKSIVGIESGINSVIASSAIAMTAEGVDLTSLGLDQDATVYDAQGRVVGSGRGAIALPMHGIYVINTSKGSLRVAF